MSPGAPISWPAVWVTSRSLETNQPLPEALSQELCIFPDFQGTGSHEDRFGRAIPYVSYTTNVPEASPFGHRNWPEWLVASVGPGRRWGAGGNPWSGLAQATSCLCCPHVFFSF
jgi:hypothetical protein